MANGSGVIVRRPAVPPPVRIRRNINRLALNDPIIVGYSTAIDRMKTRFPLDDFRSWRYQAAIHDYPLDESSTAARRAGGDPFARDGDPLPGDRNTFWRQCRHGSWFFLPWHRIYLHHFEKIAAEEVRQAGGPADWALPYWDWFGPDASGTMRPGLLPLALRDPRAGGLPNLFVAERDPRANNGQQFADPVTEVDTGFRCLQPGLFSPGSSGTPATLTFGGPEVDNHPPSRNTGTLEATPHGSMHVATGRIPGGFMASFSRAPLDPVFWLHHCNIDRLWEVWIQRASGNRNPDSATWLDTVFNFHALTGNANLRVRDVLNTRQAPLSYEYDDTTDPLSP